MQLKHGIHVFILTVWLTLVNSAFALNTQQKPEVEKPTITNFHTSWWDYINATPNEVSTRLSELLASHPNPENEEINTLIKQIKARINAWNSVKQTKTKALKSDLKKTEKNTFEFEFDRQLDQLKNQTLLARLLEKQTNVIKELKYNLKSITNEQDRLTALHLQQKNDDEKKQYNALLVIDEKIKANIVEEKIKKENAYLAQIEQLIKNYKTRKEEDTLNTIVVPYEEIKSKAQSKIDKKNKNLAAKQKSLNVIQLKNAHNVEEKGRDYAYEKLVHSELILAELEVDRATLRLDFSKVHDANTFQAIQNNKERLQALHKNIAKRGEHINDLKKQAFKLSEDVRFLLSDKIESDNAKIDAKTLQYARQSLKNYDSALSLSTYLNQVNEQLIDQTARNFLYKGSIRTKLKKHWQTLTHILGFSLFKIGDTPVTALGLLRLVLIILFSYKLAKYTRKGFERVNAKDTQPASGAYAVGRLLQYIIVVAGILIALSSVGVDFTKLAIFAGALSVGIGFGLQSIVNNFVSGLILLLERTLRVGDTIEMDTGVMGKVKEINVRSTRVTTPDNVDLIVPNAELMNNKLINWTLKDKGSRVHVPFGVAYGTDKDLVKEAALEAAKKVPFVIKNRLPHVWLVNFGDNSLDFELVVWVDFSRVFVPGSIKPTFLWEIETELSKRGIEIPFPQRDLHLRSVDESIQLTPPSVTDGVEAP